MNAILKLTGVSYPLASPPIAMTAMHMASVIHDVRLHGRLVAGRPPPVAEQNGTDAAAMTFRTRLNNIAVSLSPRRDRTFGTQHGGLPVQGPRDCAVSRVGRSGAHDATNPKVTSRTRDGKRKVRLGDRSPRGFAAQPPSETASTVTAQISFFIRHLPVGIVAPGRGCA